MFANVLYFRPNRKLSALNLFGPLSKFAYIYIVNTIELAFQEKNVSPLQFLINVAKQHKILSNHYV